MDDFLNKIAKKTKFDDFVVKREEPQQTRVVEDINFDGLPYKKEKTENILDKIPLNENIDSKMLDEFINEQQNDVTLNDIRKIIKEELSNFLSDKIVLTEEKNPQTIYFVVGKTKFKGVMEKIS